MTPTFRKTLLASSLAAATSSLASATLAEDGTTPTLEEVVITGTLIRGKEPVGAKPIAINSEAILETGAINTNEILATVPQVANFFNQRTDFDPRGSSTISRPNLRGLPGFTSASGSTTLVLVDGHRITPLGVVESSVDPNIIPSAVLDRVEIVTDGGSSLYGADAVGGVINFITKKEFEGIQMDLTFSSAEDYGASDIAITGGKKWGSGSILASFTHTETDGLQTRDRDWAARGTWTEQGLVPTGTECVNPAGSTTAWWNYAQYAGQASGVFWTLNGAGGAVTPVGEPCDILAEDTFVPEVERDNLWVSVSQDLAQNVAFNMQLYHSNQTSNYERYPLGDSIVAPTPAELGVVGNAGDFYQQASVGFSYAAHPSYMHRNKEIEIDTWGISPEFVIDMDNGWQLRQTFHLGRSESNLIDPASNTSLATAYVNSGALDPLNVGAADASVINDILDYENAQETIQDMFLARLIADGALFELPAGDVRMAAGVEFTRDSASVRQGFVGIGQLGSEELGENTRHISSGFVEIQIPAADILDLSLSVRHDDYSDFGTTTNPTVGFTLTPVDWVSIFGHWGESFNAPTALDALGTATIRNYFASIFEQSPGAVPDPLGERDPDRDGLIQFTGAGGALRPQTAESWALGFEIAPPAAEGLKFGLTYYEIEFSDALGAANPQLASSVLANPDKFIWNPTQTELDRILNTANNVDDFIALIEGSGGVENIGLILDRRTANTESALLEGIDFAVSYYQSTGFGEMSYSLAGTKTLTFDLGARGTELQDTLAEDTADLNFAGTIGWRNDNMRAKLTMRYSNGFDTSNAQLGQTSVDSFLVTDLSVRYDINESTSIRLNIDNMLDEEPPIWRQNGFLLPYSGWTLGRTFKIGFTKSFF